MSDEPGPLETATVNELLHELAKRHGAFICAMHKDDKDPTLIHVKSFWSGPTTWCLGLAKRLMTKVERELDADLDDEEIDDAEETD